MPPFTRLLAAAGPSVRPAAAPPRRRGLVLACLSAWMPMAQADTPLA